MRRKRVRWSETLPPATTSDTAVMINARPMHCRMVSTSPNMATPNTMAVTGSNAPNMAVGVEPMYCIALVVHRNDMAVGKTASAIRQPHKYQRDGISICPSQSSRPTKSVTPKSNT